MKKIEQENNDPPSRNASKPTIDTRETTFFQKEGECHASSLTTRHDGFSAQKKLNPDPEPLKSSIEDAIFIYLCIFVEALNTFEHEFPAELPAIMQPPCGES